MATFPRLVNKQFNSPIGLYSQDNIQDTLNKQTQKLQNGAMGIDFNNPINSKPANLANSAVLRMLEEEEARQRSGQPGRYTRGDYDPYVKRIDRMIDWPPKRSSNDGHINMNNTYSAKFFAPKVAGLKRVAWPPPAEESNEAEVERQSPPQRQAAPIKTFQSPAISRLIPFDTEPHAPPPSQVYSPVPKFSQPQSPLNKPLSPVPKPQTPQSSTPTQVFPPPFPESYATLPRKNNSVYAPISPKGFVPFDSKVPQTFEPKTFTPVSSQLYEPVPTTNFSPINSQSQNNYEAFSPQTFSPSSPQSLGKVSSEPGVPWASSAIEPLDQFVEPPPSTVTLRPSAPVHQTPAPVVISQPAAQTFKGGANMRGDQKWPPQNVKEAVAAENDARILLAKGPACRPRKVKKDYASFFAKNALPNNYPGYRVPPGTQHYEDRTGTSQF